MTLLSLLEKIVVPTLVIFLLLASTASTLLGLALVFRTEKALAFMRSMNRWVSTRRALRQAELPRAVTVESRRGRILLALFLLFGGGFALYVLLFRIEIPRAAVVLGVNLRRWFVTGIALQTMKWFLVLGSALALAVAVLILFFPGRLTALEARLNRWYSTRHILPPAGESMRYPLDMVVEGSPRAAGWVITAASLLVAAAMAVLLAARFTWA
jgi:hypothetical protein